MPPLTRRRVLREAALLAACLLLAMLESGIWGRLGTWIYGGGHGDPVHDAWAIHGVGGRILSDPLRLYDGNMFFPSRYSVLYSDADFGLAVLVLPLRLLSSNPVLLYNAAMLISLTLASYGFYLLAASLVRDRRAALLAAVVIPYTAQQTSRFIHLNLLTITFLPFLVLGLRRLLERPGPWAAAGTGVCFALQAATSGYHAFSALFLSFLVVGRRFDRLRRGPVLLGLGGAGLVAAVLLLPYVAGMHHIRTEETNLTRPLGAAAHYSIDALSGLFVSHSYVWSPLMPGEFPFFPGLVVVVFAAVALGRSPGPEDRFWALVAVVFLVLAWGPVVRVLGRPVGPGPYAALTHVVPFLDAMRHPLTFGVAAMMALGLLSVRGLERSGLAASSPAVALILALAVAESLGPRPLRRPVRETLPVYAYLESLPAGALLELPPGRGEGPARDFTAKWWATYHGRPVVNGAGSFEPDRNAELVRRINREWVRGREDDLETSRALAFLKQWFPVRYVLLHGRSPGTLKSRLAAATRSFRLLRQTEDGARVYELRRGGKGREVVRAFRGDQLRLGEVSGRVRGVEGSRAELLVNGASVALLSLSERPAVFTARLPRHRIGSGLNLVTLRSQAPEGPPLELIEISSR